MLHEKIAGAMEQFTAREKLGPTYYSRLLYHYRMSGNIYRLIKHRIDRLEYLIKSQYEIFKVNVGMVSFGIHYLIDPHADLAAEFEEIAQFFDDERLQCTVGELVHLKIGYHYTQGRYYQDCGQIAAGQRAMGEMLRVAQAAHCEENLADAYIRLLLYAIDSYDLEQAAYYVAQAEQMSCILQNQEQKSTVRHYKAYIAILRGDYGRGEALILADIAELRAQSLTVDFDFLLSADYFRLGESALLQRDLPRAEDYLLQAREYGLHKGLDASHSTIQIGLAIIRYHQGDTAQALQLLNQSEVFYRQSNFNCYQAVLYSYLAKSALCLSDMVLARRYAEDCRDCRGKRLWPFERKLLDETLAELQAALDNA